MICPGCGATDCTPATCPAYTDVLVRERIEAATARGAKVRGLIMRRDGLRRDVMLSDDPPGSSYGTVPGGRS